MRVKSENAGDLHLRFPPPIVEAVRAAARGEGRSVSSMLRRFITEGLRQRGYLPDDFASA